MNYYARLVGLSLGFLQASSLCVPLAVLADEMDDARSYAEQELGIAADIVDLAAEEGELVIYNLVYPNGLDSVFETFRGHFPFITFTSFSISGGALYERFRTDELAGRHTADIWQHSSPGAADTLTDEGLLLDWTPATDDLIADEWKRAGSWYPVGLYHIGLAWNHDLVGPETEQQLQGLKTWDEVAAMDWQDPIGFAHIRTGGTAYLPHYFFYETYGEKFFEDLAATKPLVLDSNVPLAERLVAGEISIVPTALDTVFSNQWSRGAPIRWVYPEPALASVYLMAASANAPHLNAAKLFLAWSLTHEGQAAWSAASGLAPASADVPDERAFTKEEWYRAPANYFSYSWNDINAALPEINEIFDRLY